MVAPSQYANAISRVDNNSTRFEYNAGSKSTLLILLVAFIFAYRRLSSHISHHRTSVPHVRNSWLRFLTRTSISKADLAKDAYFKYSKNAKVFLVSNMTGPEYIIPPSTFKELRKVPASILHTEIAIEEKINLVPVLGPEYIDFSAFLVKELNRSIPLMVPSLISSSRRAIERNFVSRKNAITLEDGDVYYKTELYPAVTASLGSIMSRVLIGEKYAKDDIWIEKMRDFLTSVSIQALVLCRVPKFVKPLITKLFPAMRRATELKDALRTDVTALIASKGIAQSTKKVADDGVQLPLLIDFVQNRPSYKNASDEEILTGVMSRLLALFFAAIETTTVTFLLVFFDIICNPRSEYADPMLEQIRTVLARHGGEWNNKALSELTLLDSFIKESQRLRPLGFFMSARKVMPENGYTFNINAGLGIDPFHLKKGTDTQLPVLGVHIDPDNYEDPETFRGFRFADNKNPSSQPSEKFLSFGYGRSACPGRSLALIGIKVMVIELLLNYEWIEMERPKEWSFGYNSLPDFKAKVTLRKKVNPEIPNAVDAPKPSGAE